MSINRKRLSQAGLLKIDETKLSKEQQAALDSLSEDEIKALIAARQKLGGGTLIDSDQDGNPSIIF